MPFAENLAVFFNTAEFASVALYTPASGSGFTVNGIFDNADTEFPVGLAAVEGNEPRFRCAVADIPSPRYGDTLQVPFPGGLVYTVQAKQQDGTGVQVIILKEP